MQNGGYSGLAAPDAVKGLPISKKSRTGPSRALARPLCHQVAPLPAVLDIHDKAAAGRDPATLLWGLDLKTHSPVKAAPTAACPQQLDDPVGRMLPLRVGGNRGGTRGSAGSCKTRLASYPDCSKCWNRRGTGWNRRRHYGPRITPSSPLRCLNAQEAKAPRGRRPRVIFKEFPGLCGRALRWNRGGTGWNRAVALGVPGGGPEARPVTSPRVRSVPGEGVSAVSDSYKPHRVFAK